MYLYVDNVEITVEAEPNDPFGHGSHVAGVIGGTGNNSGGAYTGVASGASIYSVRVLDREGKGVTSDVIAGLDWVLTNGATNKIRVVNLSLGKAVEESNTTDPLILAVEQVWDAGYVVVASAGNYGLFGNFTITSPGNSRKIITVGSLTDAGTGTDFSDDYVSTYSSRGPTLVDHVLKPDLIAPGNRFIASIPMDSYLQKLLGFLQDRVRRPADLPAAGARHDAEAAEHVAALHHGEEGLSWLCALEARVALGKIESLEGPALLRLGSALALAGDQPRNDESSFTARM